MLKKKLILNNIYLEELSTKYSSDLFKLRKRKNLTRFLSPISGNPDDQRKFIIKDKKFGNYFFGIFNNKKNLIGTIAIYNISRHRDAEWGRWICKGNSKESIESLYLLIKYAFEELKLNTIFCRTLSSNIKVLNIHKKLGFIYKCKNFKDFFLNKKYHDSIVFYVDKKRYKKIIKRIKSKLNL